MLTEGKKAPEFSLPDEEGNIHKLSDYKGKKVILYFYPRDDTPGCTQEACDFRDNFSTLTSAGIVILGVSADLQDTHRAFKEKHSLPFALLSDVDKKTIDTYGAWGEKSMYGKKYMGILRTTVVINENGIVLKIFPKVSVSNHIKELCKLLL